MPIGLSDDQHSLATALAEWATALDTPELTKRAESDGVGAWAAVSSGLADFGVVGIVIAEAQGGAGGTFLDLAVAVEACAAAMVPGALLPSAVVATLLAEQPDTPVAKSLLPGLADGSVTVALDLDGFLLGAGLTTHVMVRHGDLDRWSVLPVGADEVEVVVGPALDLASRIGSVSVDPAALTEDDRALTVDAGHVRDVAVTLAAAEAAGISRWTLDVAVDYAKVREQFGRTIGSFQAIKHLAAEMLESAESATALAWDAATAYTGTSGDDQFRVAAAVAGAAALDLAVANAQTCIQVLGGIGFTFEHHAHLYLRRAMVNREILGGSDRWRLRLTELALTGVRRQARVDLGGRDAEVRAEVRVQLEQVAALAEPDRRAALVEAGLVTPHWPAPYGRGADPLEQLVIDEEYAAAGLARPALGIGAWAAPTIVLHGTDEQRETFLRPTLLGELVWCQLFSEPGAGSDLASLRTRAERTEGGWLLTGQKVWTSLAAEADWAICLARTNPDVPQHKGITYFLVDMKSAGLEIRPLREMTGEALFNEVFLDGVFVPDDRVVGQVDDGWRLARTTLASERVAISDSSLGVSVERILRRIADSGSEVDRLRAGEAVAAAGTVKALGMRVTLRSLAGEGPGAESSVLKLVGVRQRQDSAELALSVFADDVLLGRGEHAAVVQEALVTRCLSIAGGTTQVLRNVAAERILGLPRD